MEQRHFVTTSRGEAKEASLGAHVIDNIEQASPTSQAEKLATSLELQLPANFSYEAYLHLRDSDEYAIPDKLRGVVTSIFQPSVIEGCERTRQQAIQTIESALELTPDSEQRQRLLKDFMARTGQTQEYLSATIVQISSEVDSSEKRYDQIIDEFGSLLDLMVRLAGIGQTAHAARASIEDAMQKLEASSAFLKASIMQAKTYMPGLIEYGQVSSGLYSAPPMPMAPPRDITFPADVLNSAMSSDVEQNQVVNTTRQWRPLGLLNDSVSGYANSNLRKGVRL